MERECSLGLGTVYAGLGSGLDFYRSLWLWDRKRILCRQIRSLGQGDCAVLDQAAPENRFGVLVFCVFGGAVCESGIADTHERKREPSAVTAFL